MITRQVSEIHELDYAASPGNQTDRGLSTVQAILSYVGKPFKALRNGEMQNVYGWQDLHKEHYPILGKRWLSNCNVPDLDLFPQRYKHLKSHRFYGGLELSILHLGLWLLSWPSRIGIIPRPDALAKVLREVSLWFYNFGSNDGGMHVHVGGLDHDGKALHKSWYLMGMDGKGPYIPTMPAVIIAKKLINGEIKEIGAMPCIGFFTRDEFIDEVKDLPIFDLQDEPLYRRYLKEHYSILPKQIAQLHDCGQQATFAGSANVERGNNPFCRLICNILALPKAGKDQNVRVHFKTDKGAEHWTRYFGSRKYYSKQWDQRERLYEKIGIATFVFDVEVSEDHLSLKLEKLYTLGIPIMGIFKPKVIAKETVEDGLFHFFIEAKLPLFGLLVRYQGHLTKEQKEEQA